MHSGKKKRQAQQQQQQLSEQNSIIVRFLDLFRRHHQTNQHNAQSEHDGDDSVHVVEDDELLNRSTTANSISSGRSVNSGLVVNGVECVICANFKPDVDFPTPPLIGCPTRHKLTSRVCSACLCFYYRQELDEGRLPTCTHCSEPVHPADVLPQLDAVYETKYESVSVRQFLMSQPDARYCPAPDCNFALVATEFASCPRIVCHECGQDFCYHCRQVWHPNQSCDQNTRALIRPPTLGAANLPSLMPINARLPSFLPAALMAMPTNSQIPKPCPRCHSLIIKMDDGSCNHMTCRCGAEFCWLCLKEISDLHFLSPSGCTFWGKQVWTRKKIVIWQVGTLVLAPAVIALMAGVAIPATIVACPIYAGTTVRTNLKKGKMSRRKRRALVTLASTLAFLLSPLFAALLVTFGAPAIFLYVYGVLPVHMIRTGGCVYRLRGRRLQRVAKTPKQSSNDQELMKDMEAQEEDEEEDESTKLPLEEVASNIALASFCSNSINSGIDLSNTPSIRKLPLMASETIEEEQHQQEKEAKATAKS